ncbi:hypothetical protein Hs30E_19560 [Lactococcus hodotermopsidis]|uniref:Uncharacterized protein n=1 Tax=Pseudolactococcus hodotermopsidis TaxID=2709157 RepID=A0A6A0BFC8_9LACT|nr:hypothetical protein [Lactococcus hodotermopsidis]GFH43405.1 hypothetical protein Hs30E_19560 [Lactococcus hodotermopsidis]
MKANIRLNQVEGVNLVVDDFKKITYLVGDKFVTIIDDFSKFEFPKNVTINFIGSNQVSVHSNDIAFVIIS